MGNAIELNPLNQALVGTEPSAFAPRQAEQWSMTPHSFEQALQYAKIIASSDMVPKDYRGKPGNVLVAMEFGRELNLPPLQAMQNISVINGRPAIWGDLAKAIVKRHPECELFRELSQDKALAAGYGECTIKRRGEDSYTVRFSTEDAEAAKLLEKPGPWQQYRGRMLQLRARGFAMRDQFPDALKGLGLVEEARDMTVEIESTPAPPAPAKSRTEAVLARLQEHKADLGDVLAEIAAAGNRAALAAVGEKAAKLQAADASRARCAYKIRIEEIKQQEAAEEAPSAETKSPPASLNLESLRAGLAVAETADEVIQIGILVEEMADGPDRETSRQMCREALAAAKSSATNSSSE